MLNLFFIAFSSCMCMYMFMCVHMWTEWIHTCIFLCRLEINVRSLPLLLSILFFQLPFLKKKTKTIFTFFQVFPSYFWDRTSHWSWNSSSVSDLLNKLTATKSPEMIKRRFFNKYYSGSIWGKLHGNIRMNCAQILKREIFFG